MKKNLIILIIAILVAVVGVATSLSYSPKSSADEQVKVSIASAVELMRSAQWQNLSAPLAEISQEIPNITDKELKARVIESYALIEMIFLAKMDDEEEAIALFKKRLDANNGKEISLAYYEEFLPYAKFYIFNLFLKRVDMQGAYRFTVSYPKVSSGKHVEYFSALDLFANNRVDEALAKLKILQEQDAENKMIQGSIAYIKRFKQKYSKDFNNSAEIKNETTEN